MTLRDRVEDESGVIEQIDFSLPNSNVGELSSFSYNSTKNQANIQVNSVKIQQQKKAKQMSEDIRIGNDYVKVEGSDFNF